MEQIEIYYDLNGTTKTRTFKAKTIRAQMSGQYSDDASIINLVGEENGITSILIKHAELFIISDIDG